MPTPLEELKNGENVNIEAKILALFDNHEDEAFSFGEISNGVFVSGENFDIEEVRNWMPFNQAFIFGNLRQVYYRISIINTALTLLVASGKLQAISVKNPKPHKLEWSPPYVTFYHLPK